MSILDLLKRDHADLKGLIDKAVAAEDARMRGELIRRIRAELTAHSEAEDKVFYRKLARIEGGHCPVLEAECEHEIVERLAEELAGARMKSSDKWAARCKVLGELVAHHVREEEGEMFKIARAGLDAAALDRIGAEFAKEKSKLLDGALSEAAE